MRLYNTLNRVVEEFVVEDNTVNMYVCGITPYAPSHLGHAMCAIVFDVIRRYLEYKGYKVHFIQNFTDIDDKMITAANDEGIEVSELAERNIQAYLSELRHLNVLPASEYPRATEEIGSIVAVISDLIEKEYAYAISGDVYFRVKQDEDYGKLSRRNVDELLAGARLEIEKTKENPADFALWKSQKPGEPAWDSPWGQGRPGWHIECTAMSLTYLNNRVDIHGGGQDLVFPHHENEIAQSCCANRTENFANFWLHNGFVTFNKEKMSKSFGNIVTLSKFRENINGQVVRLALLSSHYKQPLDWNEKLINESQNTLDKWYTQFDKTEAEELHEDLFHPLLEDLNTPEYISKLHLLYDETSKGNKSSKVKFLSACKFIGLLEEDKQSWENFKKSKAKVDENFINQKIKDRNNARKTGDYKLADIIRTELENNGVIIEDKTDQTTWKYK